MMSNLFNGQWTTDKNEGKYRHMSVIPFPVCEYAANHCREGRRLENISNYIGGRWLKKINEQAELGVPHSKCKLSGPDQNVLFASWR